ncbi:acyl-CoA dehydrogenase family protein [Micromonospora sp. BRA006-A]|nr:acyl-CoA dehydrogenase family protein [Micromonospora sp. BRA006-A]
MRGDLLFCQGFSEAEAGSDLAAVATTARLDADAYVLDGQKLWSSYAAVADHRLLLARTGDNATADSPACWWTCGRRA